MKARHFVASLYKRIYETLKFMSSVCILYHSYVLYCDKHNVHNTTRQLKKMMRRVARTDCDEWSNQNNNNHNTLCTIIIYTTQSNQRDNFFIPFSTSWYVLNVDYGLCSALRCLLINERHLRPAYWMAKFYCLQPSHHLRHSTQTISSETKHNLLLYSFQLYICWNKRREIIASEHHMGICILRRFECLNQNTTVITKINTNREIRC